MKGEILVIDDFEIHTLITSAWKTNCYIVNHRDSGEQLIIDPGDEGPLLIKTVLNNSPCKLRHILLTHGHHDHVGAAAALCRRFVLPCSIHKDDARLLSHAPMYAWRFQGQQIESPQHFHKFDEKTELPFAGRVITVLHTPGHTQGSACFDFGKFIFTGDTLLVKSIGRTDLPGGDADILRKSVDYLLSETEQNKILFPGHGTHWKAEEAKDWWAAAGPAPMEFRQTNTGEVQKLSPS